MSITATVDCRDASRNLIDSIDTIEGMFPADFYAKECVTRRFAQMKSEVHKFGNADQVCIQLSRFLTGLFMGLSHEENPWINDIANILVRVSGEE